MRRVCIHVSYAPTGPQKLHWVHGYNSKTILVTQRAPLKARKANQHPEAHSGAEVVDTLYDFESKVG
jgi:hypothetical protein